ncbi:MAG: VOC family protein [Acidimicrobiales bacterium]|nr:VOC family protein [Acidimicrobiales bacterium]
MQGDPTSTLTIVRTNTILYCDRWADTVAFYADTLGLSVTHRTDWFVEVSLGDAAHLSLADAARASIEAGHGAGITLSWQVPDLAAARATLRKIEIPVSDIARRWGTDYVEFHDPEGNRIELWSLTT